jgi:hypothetical protein
VEIDVLWVVAGDMSARRNGGSRMPRFSAKRCR